MILWGTAGWMGTTVCMWVMVFKCSKCAQAEAAWLWILDFSQHAPLCFRLPDTQHHAAAWQRSCRCCFSTPWSIATTIRATSTMTASSCLRWEHLCPLAQAFWRVLLGELKMTLRVVFPAGSRSSSSLFHVGGSRLPEGDGDVQFVPCWLHHGEPLNLCRSQTVGNNGCSASGVPAHSGIILTFVPACVVVIVEASAHGLGHWIYRAGSRCGLWNGLHREILWQIKVILAQIYHHFCIQFSAMCIRYKPRGPQHSASFERVL